MYVYIYIYIYIYIYFINIPCRNEGDEDENIEEESDESSKSLLYSKTPNVVKHHLKTFVPAIFKGENKRIYTHRIKGSLYHLLGTSIWTTQRSLNGVIWHLYF